MTFEKKRELIKFLMEKNYLITPELISKIPEDFNYQNFFENAKNNLEDQITPMNINYAIIDKLQKLNLIDDNEFKASNESSISIVHSYKDESKKREIQHFVSYFKVRYEKLKKILMDRPDLQNAISIKRALEKNARESIALIGLVTDKRITKKGNYLITIEDPTGEIKFVIIKDKESGKDAKDIVLDEVIGVTGTTGEGIVFANELFFPDVPLSKELKKSKDEAYAAFISDIHVGSDMFLPDDFLKFINWLNCKTGNEEQKKIASKVKYLFIVGDLVDGVGIYPGQDKELHIKDITEQYDKCAEYISMIRKDIKIIICGGNHDAIRIAEPQPILHKEFAASIYGLSNTMIVSNPAMVNIHSSDNFPGFDVLLYHGFSFDYYVANVDSIRNNGGYDRADLIMKFLLQRRHLAPTHTSTLYIPDTDKDHLIISKIPDIFATGHIHKTNVSMYRNISTICGSCWQAKTSFQEKVGHEPEPSCVPIVNLQTRQVRMMRFGEI